MGRGAVVFNGIDATTGSYLLPPMSPQALSLLARGQVFDPADLKELRWWHHRAAEAAFGPKEGIDPRNLAETGWGVIFAHDTDPAVREALGELLDHRRGQAAGVHQHHYREFSGDRAYRPGESKLTGHVKAVTGVAFSPDGRQLASAGDDEVVYLWDVGQRRRLYAFVGHNDPVKGVAFAPRRRDAGLGRQRPDRPPLGSPASDLAASRLRRGRAQPGRGGVGGVPQVQRGQQVGLRPVGAGPLSR